MAKGVQVRDSQSDTEDAEVGAPDKKEDSEDKDAREISDNLAQSKDRAQFGMTSALSLTNVSLLAMTIQRGASSTVMFFPVLALLIVSLILQISVGVLNLMVSNMKKHYARFGESRTKCTRCLFYCCTDDQPDRETRKLEKKKRKRREARIERAKVKVRLRFLQRQIKLYRAKLSDLKREAEELDLNVCSLEQEQVLAERRSSKSVECGQLREDFEEKQAKLSQAEGELRGEIQSEVVALKQLLKLQSRPEAWVCGTSAKQETILDEIREMERCLKSLRQDKAREETKLNLTLKMEEESFEVCQTIYNEVGRERALRRETNWQNVINYLVYAILVLNLFISAFNFVDWQKC